jgi:hypothetical protein
MVKVRGGDVYLIERDERDSGGCLRVLATFEDYHAAMAAWDKVPVPSDDDVQMWLVRRIGGSIDPYKSVVIDVKCI